MNYKITEKGIKDGYFDEEGTIEVLEAVDGFILQMVEVGALEPIITIDSFK